jgi:hypothetical protein
MIACLMLWRPIAARRRFPDRRDINHDQLCESCAVGRRVKYVVPAGLAATHFCHSSSGASNVVPVTDVGGVVHKHVDSPAAGIGDHFPA